MKLSLLLACSSLLASSAFAASPAANPISGDDDFVAPQPLSIVAPIHAPAAYANSAVTLELIVDAQGRPQRVETRGLMPVELQESLVSAVKQWRFNPGTRNGTPVSVRVILPLQLAPSEKS